MDFYKNTKDHSFILSMPAKNVVRDFSFLDRDTLMKVHTGKELFPCLHCDRRFILNMIHAKPNVNFVQKM